MYKMDDIEYQNQKYKLKEKGDRFRFTCDKCGGCCGNDINIMLNPYDIIRICKNKNINTSEFLKQYCYLYIGKDSKFPILALKTSPKCVFNVDNLCSIYEDRPLRCRMYPIGRVTKCNFEVDEKEVKFFVEKNCSKIHLRLQKIQTIQRWLDEQKVNGYIERSSKWNDVLIKWVKLDLPEIKIIQTAIIEIAYNFDNSNLINNIPDIEEKYNKVLEGLNDFLEMCKNVGRYKNGYK